jgi:hypothetical protein
MFGVSFLTLVVVLWAAVTVAFLAAMMWRTLLGFREEGVLNLAGAQTQQATEQEAVIKRVERATLWAKGFGFASLALLALAGGTWVYRALGTFGG